MSYNQLVKKYGLTKTNDARDQWYSNYGLRVRGTLATLDIKGCAGKVNKCLELIIKGELV